MADAFVAIGFAEKVPIYSGAWTPTTGTETLSSVTCTLRDATGAVAGGVSGTAATGFDSGALPAPTAWFDVDPAALTLTEPTYATGQSCFTLEFLATDSAGKRYRSTICLVIKPKGA